MNSLIVSKTLVATLGYIPLIMTLRGLLEVDPLNIHICAFTILCVGWLGYLIWQDILTAPARPHC